MKSAGTGASSKITCLKVGLKSWHHDIWIYFLSDAELLKTEQQQQQIQIQICPTSHIFHKGQLYSKNSCEGKQLLHVFRTVTNTLF